MQDWSKYSGKDVWIIKFGPICFLYRMKMIDENEAFRLFDLINEMRWKEEEERDG